MDIYIANGTGQHQSFHFRLPEVRGFRKIEIPVGEQVKIPNLTALQVEAVIHQGGQYKMVSHDEMDRTGRTFCGLAYCVDKPITGAKIEKLFKYNMTAKVQEGIEFRKNAAIVEAHRLARGKQEGMFPTLRNAEMSLQEEGDSPTIAEGFRIPLGGG